MREIDYTDERGRKYRVKLPDDADDSEAQYGILVGPQAVVDELGLPEPQATRLHNQLHARGIWTDKEARKRMTDIFGALQSAFQTDVTAVLNAYQTIGHTINNK